MLEMIYHKLTGFLVVSISGENCARFINLAVRSGIRFWHYHRDGEQYVVSLKIADYRDICALRRRCKVKIKLLNKRGLPFKIQPLKNHPGIIIGFCVAILLYFFLTSHIWVIGVSGEGEYSEEKILSTAESVGVFIGAERDSFDPRTAANKMMMQLPKLVWITINTDNCKAEIIVKHVEEKPNILDEKSVQNLVATRTGIIREIGAEEGIVRVGIGEGVKAGDLLVSGIWDSNDRKNEWERTDIVDIFTVSARGRIMAETTRNFEVQIPIKETVYEDGEKARRFTVGFFGLKLPLTTSFVGEGEYKRKTSENYLYLLDVKIPISFKVETLTRLNAKEKMLNEEEAKIKLDKLLLTKQRKEIAVGDKILQSEEVVYSKNKDFYTAKVQLTCLENIAIAKKVLLN